MVTGNGLPFGARKLELAIPKSNFLAHEVSQFAEDGIGSRAYADRKNNAKNQSPEDLDQLQSMSFKVFRLPSDASSRLMNGGR